jgi:hypothetical protein
VNVCRRILIVASWLFVGAALMTACATEGEPQISSTAISGDASQDSSTVLPPPTATSTGGSAGMPGGTCNAQFCPAPNGGTPCCVAANGPCGQDFGTGCVSPTPIDAGP